MRWPNAVSVLISHDPNFLITEAVRIREVAGHC